MRIRLERNVPLGINYKAELKWIALGLAVSFLYSLGFFISYSNHYKALFWYKGPVKLLLQGAVMPDFVEILERSLVGFLMLALCMLAIWIYHYAYHYQGSRSIYLMKRLPNRWELWRRCITLPALAAASSLIFAGILLIVYFWVYMASTPGACLAPDQWQKLWNGLLGALS